MTLLQAILLAAVQGISELVPRQQPGPCGHPAPALGWPIDQKAPEFLPFLVLLHLGTAAALLIYFWRDWIGLAQGVLGRGPAAERSASRRLFLLIVIGTIPAAIVGKLLEAPLRDLFGSPMVAAAFLVANGVMLLIAEKLRRQAGKRRRRRAWLGPGPFHRALPVRGADPGILALGPHHRRRAWHRHEP